MINEIKAFCQRLNMEFDEEIIPYYEKGKALYKKEGTRLVEREFVLNLHNKYNIFRKWLNEVLTCAEKIKDDSDMMLYIYILVEGYKAKAAVNKFEIPDFDNEKTGFVTVFSYLYFAEEMAEDMRKRGVPEDIIAATIGEIDDKATDYKDTYKKQGVRYSMWMLKFVHKEILRIGRLNFQMMQFNQKVRGYEKDGDIKILIDGQDMHKNGLPFGSCNCEDEDGKFYAEIEEDGNKITGYTTNEFGECVPEKVTLEGYREIIRFGDNVISVHIPSHLPLDKESCEKAYERAYEIIEKCYPEYKSDVYCCFSWLLEKRLKQIMGRDTNITVFADKYTGFPIQSNGKSCYSFLFNVSDQTLPYEALPEDSSMRKKVKEYMMSGKYYNAKGGIFLYR